ncbi:MAG: penicillin-binding protein 2 [Proteobacteria bacterium]|nr:penicillin-binding protein 2 [Candidatus Enterousia scatequi]
MYEVGKDINKFGFKRVNTATVAHRRINFLYKWIICLVFAVFVCKTLFLGIQGNDINHNDESSWLNERADIYDRNGEVLAKNIISGHIMLRPKVVTDVDATAQVIHRILPEYSVNDAIKLINESSFIYLKKFATDEQRRIVRNAKLPGLEIEPVKMRHYPKGRRFSHVVGFVGNDGHGLEGAELTYDDYLRQNKDPLYLSVDARIQEQFYTQLTIAMQKYQARGAMGMLMDSRTGEMIAMVSLPDYNPERIGSDPVRNRKFKPMRDVLEMGSIFKIFNTALAYENGINKKYYVAKPYNILDARGRVATTIHDVSSFKPSHPNFTVDEIMLHSCNVGSVQIALDLPDGAQKSFFERVHLSEPLNLEFGKTERSLMPKKWGPVEKATVSFGHGISVTPMHLLLAVNAMTNGGIYIYPTLLKRNIGRVVGERVLDDGISAKLREIMVRIAEETSGKQARVSGITIGGKTATAEKRDSAGKADSKRNTTAFIGVFPAEAPQYIILVVLDEPQGTKESWGWRTAAWNAVPTTGKILDGILPLLFE